MLFYVIVISQNLLFMVFTVYKTIRLGTDYLYYRVYDKIPDSDCFFALLFV